MMQIDYYCALSSPWSYLGHERLERMAAEAGCAVAIHPVNALAMFEKTGGLPLPKRSPERQAYRLLELQRWRERLSVPLNLHPKHFPVDETRAAELVIAARENGEDAFGLAGRFMRAVWAEERDISNPDMIAQIVSEAGLDLKGLSDTSSGIDAASIRAQDTERAIARGVFGVPAYSLGDELFWGQDRLDFVGERISR